MTQKWWDADPQARRFWDKESGGFWVIQGVLGLSLLIRAVVLGLSAERGFGFPNMVIAVLGAALVVSASAILIGRYGRSR